MCMRCLHTAARIRAASASARVLVTVPVQATISDSGLENGSFSHVVTNQAKVVAVGFQKLLPVTIVSPV